jgi:hypothetical protein
MAHVEVPPLVDFERRAGSASLAKASRISISRFFFLEPSFAAPCYPDQAEKTFIPKKRAVSQREATRDNFVRMESAGFLGDQIQHIQWLT